MSRTSSSVTHSGASTSYSRSARSPVWESNRQIFSATFTAAGPLKRVASCRRPATAAVPRSPLGRTRGALVLPLLRLPLRDRHGSPLELRPGVVAERDERVLQEVLVVAVRIVVRTRVRAARLLARDPG